MKNQTAKFLLGIAMPAALATLAFLPWALWASELPDPLASHYSGLSGPPDGSMSVVGFGLIFGLILVAFLTAMASLARGHLSPQGALVTGAVVGLMAGLAAAVLAETAWTQRGLDSWEQATTSGWHVAWVLGVALAAAAIGAWCAGALSTREKAIIGDAEAPVLNLSKNEVAAWSGGMSNGLLLALAAALIVIGGIVAVATNPVSGLVMAAAGLIAVSLSSIRVHAGPAGLTVNYGLLPWPRTQITIDRIETASAIDVRPMEWGGWGYRGSVKLMKQAAVVVRGGPGVRLDLNGNKTFVVTVPEAELPASVINGYLLRDSHVATS